MTDALFTASPAPAMDAAAQTVAFEHRLVPLMPRLLAYFQRRVDPSEDAQDCVSETLVVLWRQQHRLPADDDALRAYSFGVARKVLQNQRRGRVRRDLLDDVLRDQLRPHDSEPADTHDLRAMLGTLPEKDRELVTLVVLDGFSIVEAGTVLGLKSSAARMRYSRARARLRRLLTPHEQ